MLSGAYYSLAPFTTDTQSAIADRQSLIYQLTVVSGHVSMLFSLEGIVPYLTQFIGEVDKKLYNPLTFYLVISFY